jgi:hypothetical protein
VVAAEKTPVGAECTAVVENTNESPEVARSQVEVILQEDMQLAG